MADFVPTTTVYLFARTGVTPQNQPFFTNQSEKIAWYMQFNTKSFENYSYQRENRQYIRVQGKAADLRVYDMMAFRNEAFDRWIICRIIEVEFVNPNCTQITFETDSMQTFIDTLTFEMSWVEREMWDDDWNGQMPTFNSLMTEGIETGVQQKNTLQDTFSDIQELGMSVVALSAYDENAESNYNVTSVSGFRYGLNEIPLSTANQINTLLKTYADKGRLDGIVGFWMVPNSFSDPTDIDVTITLPYEISGYRPKNSKCFCSEFCQVEVSNRQGTSSYLAPELLFINGGRNASITLAGAFLGGAGGIIAYPKEYKGYSSATVQDLGVVLPMNVQTCFIGNAFANWVGQNRVTLMAEELNRGAQLATGALGVAAGVYTMNPIIAGAGVKNIANSLYQTADTMKQLASRAANPAGIYGQSTAGGLACNQGYYGFSIYFNGPDYATIKSIDDFFSMYGYRTCRLKKPNVDTRPYWNYVKCAPAVVRGPMTSKDKEAIMQTLNAGVTFWHVTRGASIGNYSLDNRG